MPAEVLLEGLAWPEGPAAREDGSLTFVESDLGRVCSWSQKGFSVVAITGGRPNASAVCSDGSIYVTQAGSKGEVAGITPAPPSIQHVAATGEVVIIATAAGRQSLLAPNDLAFGPDGLLYFTDPGRWDPVGRPDTGRICRLLNDGSCEILLEVGRTYPNGIAFDLQGRLVWAESYTRAIRRLSIGGEVELLARLPDPQDVPDGLAIADDGTVFVAATTAGGLFAVDPAGSIRLVRVGSCPTNCCFLGPYLYVTDGGQSRRADVLQLGGSLFRMRVDCHGAPVHRGSPGTVGLQSAPRLR